MKLNKEWQLARVQQFVPIVALDLPGCNACVEVAFYRWHISKKDGKCTLIGGIDKRGIYRVIPAMMNMKVI